MLIHRDRKRSAFALVRYGETRGRDADLSRQAMRRWFGAVRRGKPASRDRFSSAPSREVFHSRRRLGRSRAGSCVRHESPVFLPAFSYSAGFSLYAGRSRRWRSRSITSLVASGEHWPTALQRSDAKSLRASRRCRIYFCAMVGRRCLRATRDVRPKVRFRHEFN